MPSPGQIKGDSKDVHRTRFQRLLAVTVCGYVAGQQTRTQTIQFDPHICPGPTIPLLRLWMAIPIVLIAYVMAGVMR